jgi:aspartyl-tRNA(Asn)/glutamyl-tRNA(Gln) amidotransferase subunit A
VTPFDPLKIGEDLDDPMKMYLIDVLSVTANLAGIPSLSVPAGFSSQDLPIGVQIMGKHFDEKVLYRVGKVIEDQLKMYERRPAL